MYKFVNLARVHTWLDRLFAQQAVITTRLEQLVLKSHVVLRLESDTGTEDVGKSSALLAESVDNRCSSWGQRSLDVVSVIHVHFGTNDIP